MHAALQSTVLPSIRSCLSINDVFSVASNGWNINTSFISKPPVLDLNSTLININSTMILPSRSVTFASRESPPKRCTAFAIYPMIVFRWMGSTGQEGFFHPSLPRPRRNSKSWVGSIGDRGMVMISGSSGLLQWTITTNQALVVGQSE